MNLKLNKPFISSGNVDEFDVRQIKRVLNRLGYYMPPQRFGSTHIPDREVFEALRQFQNDHGLLPNATARPEDVTETALNNAVERQDPSQQYIWRTRKDDKVRDEHATREGQIYTWGTEHDDGHPGEPFGCRCWAEPVSQKVPIPKRKPNCSKEQEDFDKAKEKFEQLGKRRRKLEQEVQELEQEKQKLINRLRRFLGSNIVPLLITLPLPKPTILINILQRFFSAIVSKELAKAAEKIGKEFKIVSRKLENKKDQLIIVIAELKKASEEVAKTHQKLEECKKRISIGI